MEIVHGSIVTTGYDNTPKVTKRETEYVFNIREFRVPISTVNDLLAAMTLLDPEDFAALLHTITGMCIASKDSVKFVREFTRLTCKYESHRNAISEVLLEVEKRGI